MSSHYKVKGLKAFPQCLVIYFTEEQQAFTRFREIKVPYSAFTDRDVRMILSHYKSPPTAIPEEDSPIPDLG